MPRKRTPLFIVIVVFAFVLMTYQTRKGAISVNFISGPLNSLHAVSHSISEAIRRPFRVMALREKENIELRKKVGELLLEEAKSREILLENRRLKELLALREYKRNYITSAQVIARGIDNWTHTLLIDKGSSDGVVKDMSAITPRGLAGKITGVSASYAHILLLTDRNFSAAVRLQGNRTEGVLSGTGSRTCILKYVPSDAEVKVGDIVITSGLDMLFAPGIPVGYVTKVNKRGVSGDLQHIEVQPFQDSARMEEVVIIK